MKIKASNSLRGEVVFPSINRSLIADQELTINEEHYWKEDIQKAIQFGLITLIEGTSTVAANPQRRYTLMSHNKSTLILPSVSGPIEPQQEFTVPEKAFNSIDIQQAMSYGLLEVVNISGDGPDIVVDEDYSSQDVKVDTKEKWITNAKPKKIGRAPKPLPEIAAPKRETLKPTVAKTKTTKVAKTKVAVAAAPVARKNGPSKKGIRPVGSGRRTVSNEDAGYGDDGIEMEIL